MREIVAGLSQESELPKLGVIARFNPVIVRIQGGTVIIENLEIIVAGQSVR